MAIFGGIQHYANSRADIHVLVVGDPGLGKSQMLRACCNIAPRGKVFSYALFLLLKLITLTYSYYWKDTYIIIDLSPKNMTYKKSNSVYNFNCIL